MKGVISNRIYLNCDKNTDLEDKLNSELIYSIDRMPQSQYPEIIKHVQRVTDTVISIPSGRMDLVPEGTEMKDKRAYVDVEIPEPSFTLYPDQQRCLEYFMSKATSGGLVSCKPG